MITRSLQLSVAKCCHTATANPNVAADPQLWSLQQSYTMPLLANGHTSGLLHGTLPRGRLEHVAATCSRYELRQAAEMEVDCVKSYDHLLAGGMLETDTQGVIDSTSGSGVQQSEVSQCRLGGQFFQIFFSRTFMFLRPYDEGLYKKNC